MGGKNSHYNFTLNTRQFDGICYCKVKNGGNCQNRYKTSGANWQNTRKTFGGYRHKHYICAIYQRLWRKMLYCSSVRCTTDCSNGRGAERRIRNSHTRSKTNRKVHSCRRVCPKWVWVLHSHRLRHCTGRSAGAFNDISDLNYIFLRLQLIYRVQLIERKSAIIFDEIQKAPLARQAIKHLVKDRRYDYIETGSLITVHKSSQDILLPSEETRIDMFPMDYEEFRWALGDTATIPLLRTAFEKRIPLGDAVHRRMMRDFRLYMLVGVCLKP